MEKTLKQTEIYNGKILKLRVDDVLLPNGKTGFREVVSHNGAVAAVPVLDDTDRTVILVRQYRYAVSKDLLEIPAGKIEPGESPAETIRRELCEEIKMKPKNLLTLSVPYLSPGYSSERIYICLATGLEDCEEEGDSDEFLEIVKIPYKEAYSKAMLGYFNDAKTTLGIILAHPFLNSKISLDELAMAIDYSNELGK